MNFNVVTMVTENEKLLAEETGAPSDSISITACSYLAASLPFYNQQILPATVMGLRHLCTL